MATISLEKALRVVKAVPGFNGNKPGSHSSAKDFERFVSNTLRAAGNVRVRPNGNNQNPAMTINGIPVIVKTAKNGKPMWNETIPPKGSIVILNLGFGTVVCHSESLLSDSDRKSLENIKSSVASAHKHKGGTFKYGRFGVVNARVQFADNVMWEDDADDLFDECLRELKIIK